MKFFFNCSEIVKILFWKYWSTNVIVTNVFYGKRINEDETPEYLGMVEENNIEIFREQLGGGEDDTIDIKVVCSGYDDEMFSIKRSSRVQR